jgi:hypothetical protein
MSKKIPLTKGKFAIVDAADFEYLNRFRWIYNRGVFATLLIDKKDHDKTTKYVNVPMAHFIIAPKNNCQIGHKNGVDLDFRKGNLIYIQESIKTHRGRKRLTHFGEKPNSKYKGVGFRKDRPFPWVAGIQKDKKHYYGSELK